MSTGSIKLNHKITIYIFTGILIILAGMIFIPFLWMISSSLKLNRDVFTYPMKWIPDPFVFENYKSIWLEIPLLRYVFNSLKLTVIITIIQVITSSFAAYGFAKLQFPGRNILFLTYVCTIAIPWQTYMIPQFIIFRNLGLVNTHMSLIILQSFTAFGVFLIRQFYLSVPNELCEAARIDGMSEYGIYRRIMLPLSQPVLATLVIFSFVNVWNDYMAPLVYLNSDRLITIQLGLRSFITDYSSEYNLIMAGAVIALVPVFIIFVSLQRYFVEGIATTGLKG